MRKAVIPFLAVLVIAAPVTASAADWYTGSGTGTRKANSNFGVSIDASVAATTQNAVHVSVIGTIAPFTALDKTGMRLRIGGLTGSYKYISTAAGVGGVTGQETSELAWEI